MATYARVLWAAVVLGCTLSAAGGAAQALERVVTAHRLVSGEKLAGRLESFAVSPDRTRVAYVVEQRRAQYVMVIDGQAGTPYDGLERALFSPDSRRVAYVARVGPKHVVVVDGQPGVPYDRLAAHTLTFSPDSKRLAYAALAGARWVVVVDGQAGPPYEGNGDVVFSPDSKRLAYAVQVGSQRFIVVDGRAEQPYDDLVAHSLVFSPDSRHLAYGAMTGEKAVVVVDGKPGVPSEGIGAGAVLFSPDSKHLAYAVPVGAKWVVVVDGKKGPAYDSLVADTLTFSPDSKRLAYAVSVGPQRAVVVDGHLEARYAGIGAVRFSPDSRRVAYAAEVGQQQVVVVDGQPGTPSESVVAHTLTFSPESRHVAYVARMGSSQVVVVDGQPGALYPGILTQRIHRPLGFTAPDRLAYLAFNGTDVLHIEEQLRGGASPSVRSQPAPQGLPARLEEQIRLLASPDPEQGAAAALTLIAIGPPVVEPLQRQVKVWQQLVNEGREYMALQGALRGGLAPPNRGDYPQGRQGRDLYEERVREHDRARSAFARDEEPLRPLWRALGFAQEVLTRVQGR